MNELDNEDSKKDTLVDVVFKKALKEFRQNIFSFYSSALAVSDRMMGEIFHHQEKQDTLGLAGGGDAAKPSIPGLLVPKDGCSSIVFSLVSCKFELFLISQLSIYIEGRYLVSLLQLAPSQMGDDSKSINSYLPPEVPGNLCVTFASGEGI